MASFEYVDVIETTDGSILKGVVFENEPGVRYKLATADGSVHVILASNVVKLTKARNKNYRGGAAVMSGGDGSNSLSARYDRPGSSLPKPFARSGLRAEFDLAIVFPGGDIEATDTSFAPTVRIGFEQLFGNFGLSGGGLGRFTYWMIPGDTGNAAWTLETHAYARAAFHLGRVVPYGGLSLGTDLNYGYYDAVGMSETELGFGANLFFGVGIAATPVVSFDFGGDYHPGTDSIPFTPGASIEYFALRLGAHLRL